MTSVTSTSLLSQLREQGLRLWAIDDRLCYKPIDLVTHEILQVLKTYKPELLQLIVNESKHEIEQYRAMIAGLPAQWRERFEERAAIFEFEAHKSRSDAELFAFIEVVAAMIAAISLDQTTFVR